MKRRPVTALLAECEAHLRMCASPPRLLERAVAAIRSLVAELEALKDPHSPHAQAVIEQWLLAYQKGEARAGVCTGIVCNFEHTQREREVAIAATKLRSIAETGEHPGTFAGEEMEQAAQAILKLFHEVGMLKEKLCLLAVESTITAAIHGDQT